MARCSLAHGRRAASAVSAGRVTRIGWFQIPKEKRREEKRRKEKESEEKRRDRREPKLKRRRVTEQTLPCRMM